MLFHLLFVRVDGQVQSVEARVGLGQHAGFGRVKDEIKLAHVSVVADECLAMSKR